MLNQNTSKHRQSSSIDDPAVRSIYLARERTLKQQRALVAFWLLIVLWPSGSFIDFFLYPEHWKTFFIIRMAFEAYILVVLFSLQKKRSLTYIVAITYLAVMAIALQLSYFIYLTDGVYSSYYAVFNIIFLTGTVLLLWEAIGILILCGFVLFFYGIACYKNPFFSSGGFYLLFTQSYYVLLTSIISATAISFNRKQRIENFLLSHSLDIKNSELIRLDKMKSDFFANVTHELRTPLTLIIAPLQQLKDTSEHIFSKEIKNIILLMHGNCMRLLKMINDLLEFSRMQEKFTNNLEEVNLNTILGGLVDSLRHYADTKGVNLTYETAESLLVVSVDRDALERIILNLVTNAIKFTQSSGSITVRCYPINKTSCHIIVEDTGIGISESDLPHVFERFYRGTKKQGSGSGLGLMLVKELVEKMNGTISVSSVEQEGTKVTIMFPTTFQSTCEDMDATNLSSTVTKQQNIVLTDLQKKDMEQILIHDVAMLKRSEQMQKQTATEHSASLEKHNKSEVVSSIPSVNQLATPNSIMSSMQKTKPKILIVDDELEMLNYIASILNQNYEVTKIDNGKQAIELAITNDYAVILLDMMMPDMSGLEVCQYLKSYHADLRSRILVITAISESENKLLMLENGAHDFLSKPFSYTELIARTHNLVVGYKLESELIQSNHDLKISYENLERTHKQLTRVEKLRSVGTMAAGLIHEINNPVNYSMMALDSLYKQLPLDSQQSVAEPVQDLKYGLQQIVNTIQGLRDFAQKGITEEYGFFSFQQCIQNAVKLSRVAHDKNLKIAYQLNAKDEVDFPEQLMVQLMINFLTNAHNAISKRRKHALFEGKITIRTSNQADNLVIEFIDNGIGMSAATLERAYDPFYVDNEDMSGIGLGLSICYTIIKNHHGDISIDSAEGQGCRVVVHLPTHRKINHLYSVRQH